MFGLEDQKKKKDFQPFIFDLEKELKDPKKGPELKKRVEERIQEVKTLLRSGESKDEFDHLGALLQAYTALLKVFGRVTAKSK